MTTAQIPAYAQLQLSAANIETGLGKTATLLVKGCAALRGAA